MSLPLATVTACCALALAPALPSAAADAAAVVRVAPEGVTVDAAAVPQIGPGVKVMFVRPGAQPDQVGEGYVLDVHEGQALVGVKPGVAVRPGDVAIACATPSGSNGQQNLRATVQSLDQQLKASGAGTPDVQSAIAQLEAALDAREAAIRGGACDVSAQDQQIASLAGRLQDAMAASQPATAASAAPTSGSQAAPFGAGPAATPPGSATSTVAGPAAAPFGDPGPAAAAGAAASPAAPGSAAAAGSTATPFPDAAAAAMPGASAAPPSTGGGTAEALSTALQIVQQLAQLAQTTGLGSRGGGAPPASAAAQTAPAQGAPPPSPTAPDPATAAAGAPPPPSAVQLAAAPPTSASDPSTQARAADAATSQASTSAPFTGTGSGSASLSGSGDPPATSGGASGPGVAAPATSPPPSAAHPDAGRRVAIVDKNPSPAARLASLRGTVRAENGAAIASAVVFVGGKQFATNAQGAFAVELSPGRQVVLVRARGFQDRRVLVEVPPGGHSLALTLRRAHAGRGR